MKGISPLVATVLLIAVTMTIAGVLAVFAQNLVSTNLQNSAQQPVATPCQFSSFKVDICKYNSGTQTASFILDNIGNLELSNVTAFFEYPDNTVNAVAMTGTIGKNSVQGFTATTVAAGFSKVHISTQCPNTFQEITSDACK